MSTVRRPGAAFVAVLLACALALGTLSACTSSGGKYYTFSSATGIGKLIPIKDRKAAQPFSGSELLTGKTLASTSTKGKVTVVNFWASWCGPCQAETPELGTLYRAVHKQGIDFLGIDSHEGERGDGRSFVRNHDIGYPMIYDQAGELAIKLGNPPANLPFTILLDKQGRVAAVWIVRFTMKDLQDALTRLRAES